MTPRGAEHLIAMRMCGQRPAGSIFIQHGDFREPDWWKWADSLSEPELLIRPADPIDRLDLRCLLDLPVILFLPTWGDREARLYERLQEVASEIAVVSPAFDLDCGWRWLRDIGRVEFNFTATDERKDA